MTNKEELRTRLIMEMSKPKRIELISASELKRLLLQSQFQCPRFKDRKTLCFNYMNCPPRPRPCETCKSWRRYKGVFKARKSTQQIINDAFTKLQKTCSKCNLLNMHYDEPNYFEECRRAIRARTKLERKDKGEIQVKQSKGPVFD